MRARSDTGAGQPVALIMTRMATALARERWVGERRDVFITLLSLFVFRGSVPSGVGGRRGTPLGR